MIVEIYIIMLIGLMVFCYRSQYQDSNTLSENLVNTMLGFIMALFMISFAAGLAIFVYSLFRDLVETL